MLSVAGAAAALTPLHCASSRAALLGHYFIPRTSSQKPNWGLHLSSNHERPRGSSSAHASRRRRSSVTNHDDDDDDEEEEEEEEVIPFREMSRWLKNKPAGFGEGKVYDTSVEERLLEEMESSRKAQLSNLNKLKNEPNNAVKAKKKEPQKKVIDVPMGIRVRVSNLPRKKNIYRDLQLAFGGFPGIINISPAVIGNLKTRDPICKGFAFLDLESEEVAKRFVRLFSKQNVVFGKVQKQITCNIMNASSSFNIAEQSSDSYQTVTKHNVIDMGDEVITSSHLDNLPSNYQERTLDGSTSSAVDGEFEDETFIQQTNNFVWNDSENGTSINGEESDSDDSSASPQKQKKPIPSRKKTGKTKTEKTSKLSIPSSLVRLKVRERAVLTGVLSKYGGKVASASSKGG